MSNFPIGQAEVVIYTYGKMTTPLPCVKYYVNVAQYRDPSGQKQLKALDGTALSVQEFMTADKRVPLLVSEIEALAHLHVRAGKESHITVGLEDHHGKWIAPAIAELVAARLDKVGFRVATVHRALT